MLLLGKDIPTIGMGTFGSDRYPPNVVSQALPIAYELGFRHFDCAAVYGNEKEIGDQLQALLKNGVRREDLWITSKLWNNRHSDPVEAFEESLRELKLEYLDLYLIHWPFPNYHAAGVGVDSRDPSAKPFSHDRYLTTWQGLEQIHRRGLVRHIGTSNMSISKLEGLLRSTEVAVSANEMELHPHFQQPELFNFCVSNEILPIGFSPLGSPSRPERDRTVDDSVDLEDPLITRIALAHGISPASVAIKWAVQRGQVPIPFSVKRDQLDELLAASTSTDLTSEEMTLLASIDKNCRLIKGQVFLWKGAENWQELWA